MQNSTKIIDRPAASVAKSGSTAQLATLISVFFFWGFVAASNDILIPVLKDKLHLAQWQGQLVSLAFYIAYSVGSFGYYLISKIRGKDLLNTLGYKNGISLGLLISALGTLLFIPAADNSSFLLMISGLFIVGLGFSLQQTAANPLAINIGDPSKGAQRLSLAGGINNIGTTIGPVLLSLAIFGSVQTANTVADLSAVKLPYLLLGAAFLVVAAIFKFSSIPNHLVHAEETPESISKERSSALKYPQLWMGMIAIFLYVGVEVATGSNLAEFIKQYLQVPTNLAAPYVSLFWASLMIGRWSSAVEAMNISKIAKQLLGFVIPYLAFGLFLFVNSITNHNIEPFYLYAIVIVILIGANYLSKGNPARQLIIYSICGIIALLVGMFYPGGGMISAYAFISVGLFCSTLWPCIFTLAINGLGKRTNEGSGFLIMMIMGGGFVSFLQGYLANDAILGIRYSYSVGVLCFIYLAFYGWKTAQVLKKQGLSYENNSSSGH
jgi:FHS family L-fucose permease-like MFS transporter